MSEEEKKAIEKLDYISDFIIENGQYNADVEDLQPFVSVLNLIEKQQKRIESLEEKERVHRNIINGYYRDIVDTREYISKQVIRDKIKEYEKELEINKDNVMCHKLIYTSTEVIREKIQALKELLGENYG